MEYSAGFRLPLFVGATFAAAILALTASLKASPFALPAILPALIIVAVVADAMTVQVSSVTVSMVFPILAATTILYGPTVGGISAAIATLPSGLMAREKRLLRTFFNVGQLSLAFLAAGWAYQLAGARPIGASPLLASEIPGIILPLCLFAAVSLVVNSALVASAASLDAGIPFMEVWRSSFAWTIPTQSSLAVLSLALAQVIASEGVVGLGLFVVPLLIARQFYERYLTLKKTYAETVRSLVAVIEAKDAYTRGHSERVASYAIDVGRRLGFSDDRVERVELAALLHDLGKVGISRRILSKKTRLSDEEFEVIKTHPEIGAHIIEEVPFLTDLVPFISGHHERLDGSGYGGQLSGEDIPIEARVLAVADAFDAMTSSRPYRAAMSATETVRELRRCSGTQFDPIVVETFVEALASGGFAEVLSEDATDEAV